MPAATAASLHLLIPGLLGPLPASARDWEALSQPSPSLVDILARGDRAPAPRDYLALIDSLFSRQPAGPLPAAALSLLADVAEPGDGHWLRADPVHLQADRDRVVLVASLESSLPRAEADALVADCNRFLAEDGLELRIGASGHWYLRSREPVDLVTAPTASVVGHYIDDHLPQGADVRRWLRLGTELQMLLHGSAVNQSREARGEPTVNSLWPWGGGALPAKVEAPWRRVRASEPTLLGLARLAGAETRAEVAPAEPAAGPDLVLLDGPRTALGGSDYGVWRQALADIETHWLAPALTQLESGGVATVELITEGGRYRLTRSLARRFWRRRRPLIHYLEFTRA